MSERIEGLFLRSTKIKHNSIIVDVLTANYGRCAFLFTISNKNKTSYVFQPFHFIEFSSTFNFEKKINTASNADLVFPVINIISDIRKTGYALLITEILTKVIHQQENNLALYISIKKLILKFETQSFNSSFGIFFILNLLHSFGIQPINNFNEVNNEFDLEEGKFCAIKKKNFEGAFPNKVFSELLGTKVDYNSDYKLSTVNRRLIMNKLLNYMQFHGLINTDKIKSIQILQSLYD